MDENLTKQINVAVTQSTYDVLIGIKNRHKILPNVLARELLVAAAEFYARHGWFSFPVVIEPEEFQRNPRAIAAENGQAAFGGPPAGAMADALEATARATPPRKEQVYPPGSRKNRAPRG